MRETQKDPACKPAPLAVLQAVINLRKSGCTYAEIGSALGISSVQARRLLLQTKHYQQQPAHIQGADGKWRPSRYYH